MIDHLALPSDTTFTRRSSEFLLEAREDPLEVRQMCVEFLTFMVTKLFGFESAWNYIVIRGKYLDLREYSTDTTGCENVGDEVF